MLIHKNGDLLKSGCDIIGHQVNTYGCMGAGIAAQIKYVYPWAFEEYHNLCKRNEHRPSWLYGICLLTPASRFNWRDITPFGIVANLFGQDSAGTNYTHLRTALQFLKNYAQHRNKTVGLPYGIGCGIGGGDWEIVEKIITEVFDGYEVEIWKL